MAEATTLLEEACTSGIACLSNRNLLIVTAQALALSVSMTGPELLSAACESGIACLDNRNLLVVTAQGLSTVAGTCVIITTELPNGTDGTPYSETIESDTPGATFTVTAGALPDGLTLHADGTIDGTPTLANPYDFTVQATVPGGGTCSQDLTITVVPNEPPVFEPPDLPNLVAWYKPETLSALSDDETVMTWPDSGLGGLDLTLSQGTPKYKLNQINGVAGVRFDGASVMSYGLAVPASTTYSGFVVFQVDSAAGTQYLVKVSDGVGWGMLINAGDRSVIHQGVAFCNDAAATTDAELWSAVRTSAPLLKFYVNSVNEAIGNDTSNVFATVSAIIVGAQGPFSGFLTGVICEMLLYDTSLSDVDRGTIETYLISKYAL